VHHPPAGLESGGLRRALIQSQVDTLQVHEAREATLEAQAEASGRAAEESRLEAKVLRLSLAAIPKDQPWGVGPLIGCTLKGELRVGAIVSRSWPRGSGPRPGAQ